MVNIVRHFYSKVDFIVPDRAMSAGTVFALSADNIYMNYFSYLGPIDPQIYIGDALKPALGYLAQFERLVGKAKDGQLTDAEALLLNKLDLADLYQYEQARAHSVELLVEWLSTYKFKNWNTTETNGTKVTEDMKRKRAEEIATVLNDTARWHSHGRGINMKTARDELQLKIHDFDDIHGLGTQVRLLFDLVTDYVSKAGINVFVRMWTEKEGSV